MKTSKKTLFTIILIISLSVLLPCGAIVLDFAFSNDFTKCLSLIMCLTGYNFLIRTIIGQTGFPYLVVIGSVFSAVWDMQYVILQRYNRPKIVRLMKDFKLTQM